MTVARALGARGIPVVLIEKEDRLGGILGDLNHLYPSYRDSALYVKDVAQALTSSENIEVLTGSRVLAVSGHVGEYTLTVRTADDEREHVVGAVVVATGCDVLVPDGLYDYGGNPKVVAQLELEQMLREGLGGAKRFVMIQCVGSRNEERPYCSRVCCTATVKNTIAILDSVPDAEITVLSRGFAQYVGDLERAREAGVTFRRYDPERPPVVHADAVEVFDVLTASEVAIPYDLVVLATPLLARPQTAELADMLDLPVDQHGFVAEPHSKLRPDAFAPSGIFVAGSAHWPATVTECQSQAMSSAARAALLVGRGEVEREPFVAVVDELTCRGCGECAEVCAHGAPALSEGSDGLRLTSIDAVKCRGCGVCIRVCPSTAISLEHMTEEQLLSMVDVAAG
jgi:heterodisulfide reductase subunit A